MINILFLSPTDTRRIIKSVDDVLKFSEVLGVSAKKFDILILEFTFISFGRYWKHRLMTKD